METKANYTIVGLFAVFVTAAAFGFIYWYAELWQTGKFARIVVQIPGSAAGLNVGAPVRFNGIPVGQVTNVNIDLTQPKFVNARAEISVDTPINASTIIKLEAQGLTGASILEISTPEGAGTDMLLKAYEQGTSIQFEASPSGIANLLETAEKIMVRTDAIVGQVENFVTTAQDPINATLKNAETFSKALTDNAEGIDEFLKSVSGLTGTIQSLSTRIDGTLASADRLLTAIDPQKIVNTLANFEKLSGEATLSLAKIDKLVSEVQPGQIGETVKNITAASNDARVAIEQAKEAISGIGASSDDISKMISDVSETAQKLNAASGKVDALLSEVKPGQIGKTLEDISTASADARVALAEAKKVVETVGGRSGDIDEMISTVGETAKQLNSATQKVDTLLAEVDPAIVRQALSDISTAGTDARETLAEAKKVVSSVGGRSDDIDQMITDVSEIAKRLNAASSRVDGVLAKLDGFLGDGDSSSLMTEAQDTLKAFKDIANNLNRRIGPIASNLERFTGSGLQDVEALVVETRRSISRIERSITEIEKNPQRLIFGGETVKQFDGRTRR
ncbi:MAG: MlaD family protein [Lentilitoribacter sp.]